MMAGVQIEGRYRQDQDGRKTANLEESDVRRGNEAERDAPEISSGGLFT